MAVPDLPDCVDLLERLQEQQLRLNDQLLTLTARLGDEHAVYAEALALQHERLARADAILARRDQASAPHAERLERFDQVLQAIKDLLERGNGH